MPREIPEGLEVRKTIDTLIRRYGPRRFPLHMPDEMTQLEATDEQRDCEQYALGTAGVRNRLLGRYPAVQNVETGDLTLYYKDDRGVVHVGTYQGNDEVHSKWGGGPVLKHPIPYVPSSYGNTVFFRRVPEEDLEKLRQQDPLQIS